MTGPNDPTEPTPTWSAPSPADARAAARRLRRRQPAPVAPDPADTAAVPAPQAQPGLGRDQPAPSPEARRRRRHPRGRRDLRDRRRRLRRGPGDRPGQRRAAGRRRPVPGRPVRRPATARVRPATAERSRPATARAATAAPAASSAPVRGITISGEVTAVSADQLTLKLASGQTIQVGLNGSTTYHSQAPATAADVTTGSTVQVQVGPRRGGNGDRPAARAARRGGLHPRRRDERDGRPEVTRGPARPVRCAVEQRPGRAG